MERQPGRHDTATGLKAKTRALHHLDPVILDTVAERLPHRSVMNWPRKVFHMIGIGSAGLTLAFCSLSTFQAWSVIAVLAVLIIGCDLIRFKIPKLNEKAYSDFKFIMRDYERKSVTGMTWFMLAMLIVSALVTPKIAGLAALLLAFGDPWASFFGIRFGKRRLFGTRKTLEGLAGGFGVCALVSALYFAGFGLVPLAWVLPAALLAGLAGAVAESLPVGRLDDNFVIPVAVTPALVGILALFGA